MLRSNRSARLLAFASCLTLLALATPLHAQGKGNGGGKDPGPPPDWALAATGWGGYLVGPLVLITADGSQSEKITGFDIRGAARWSPDGTRLAFHLKKAAKGNPQGVYVIGADGTGMYLVDAHGSSYSLDWSPVPAPDGREKIAWCDGSDLYIANTDGSAVQNLTSGMGLNASFASFAPTGDRVVVSGYPTAYALDLGLVDGQLAVTAVVDLAPSGPLAAMAGMYECCWSPADDCVLVYSYNLEYTGYPDGIWRIDLTTLDQTWLGAGRYPDVNSAGTEILFSWNGDLWWMLADGSNAQPFVHSRNQGAMNPTWRPGY